MTHFNLIAENIVIGWENPSFDSKFAPANYTTINKLTMERVE